MKEFIKKFNNHNAYTAFTQTADFVKPNVSLCIQENEIHYNPIPPPLPNNVIKYEASAKLTETTSDKSSGLHTNAFNTTIVSHTFENGVGTIEFEDDVTTMQGFAFFYTPITKLIMPNTVTTLGYKYSGGVNGGVFTNCSNLEEVILSNNLIEIGDYTFYYCTSLTSVTIPSSVTNIGSSAFGRCNSLINVVVDSGNNVYDSRNNCNAIIETATNTLIAGCKETVIPNSVTGIGDYAFYYCDNLSSITIPNSVTSIGEDAFFYCTGLTNITIPDSVTSIGNAAFMDCSGLTSVTIGSGVTSIGDRAFSQCYRFTSINIPSGVTSIGDQAFSGCRGLTSVTIPNSVTSIGQIAFYDCRGLTSVTIGSGITSISKQAFDSCSNLTSIIIPNSVTSIGDWAFDSCSSLISVTIGSGVTSIGNSAFSYCTGLTNVTIPNNVTSISSSVFYNCSHLTSVTVEATTPPTLSSSSAFSGNASGRKIYVPATSVTAYQTATNWRIYAADIEAIPTT